MLFDFLVFVFCVSVLAIPGLLAILLGAAIIQKIRGGK